MSMLKWLVTLSLCAFTLGARAEDKAMLIELSPGVLPNDISSSGMVVGSLRSGGGFYWQPTTGAIYG